MLCRSVVLNRLYCPGDFFGCHNWERHECYWHLEVEARDAAKCPTVHRTAPIAKNYSTPNVKMAEAEKPWIKITS